jgi:type IV/VI secretion system ImpK/VasF family protein
LELIDYYSGLLKKVISLEEKDFDDVSLLHTEIRDETNAICQTLEGVGYSEEIIKLSKFAVIAFIDAKILGSDPPKVDWWRKNKLQLELFDTEGAGHEFFKKMDKIFEMTDNSGNELLRFYLYQLFLGFEGELFESGKRDSVINKYYEKSGSPKGSYTLYSLAIRDANHIKSKPKKKSIIKNPRLYVYLYYLILSISAISLYIAGNISLAGVTR